LRFFFLFAAEGMGIMYTRERERKASFSEFHPHAMCWCWVRGGKAKIKIYGSDGNIIQFSVFMAHFGGFSSPHSKVFPSLSGSVCRMQTLKRGGSFKTFLPSILFMFAFVSNDEITEKLRKFYFLWVGRHFLPRMLVTTCFCFLLIRRKNKSQEK
jgi:hypothetical protein